MRGKQAAHRVARTTQTRTGLDPDLHGPRPPPIFHTARGRRGKGHTQDEISNLFYSIWTVPAWPLPPALPLLQRHRYPPAPTSDTPASLSAIPVVRTAERTCSPAPSPLHLLQSIPSSLLQALVTTSLFCSRFHALSGKQVARQARLRLGSAPPSEVGVRRAAICENRLQHFIPYNILPFPLLLLPLAPFGRNFNPGVIVT